MKNIPTFEQLTEIYEKYPWASWALWSEDFDQKGCLEQNSLYLFDFFNQNISKLKCDVIFLGLNMSKKSEEREEIKLKNFHSVPHAGDRRLKKYIQEDCLSYLSGGFMTDLISEIIEPNSNRIKRINSSDIPLLIEQFKVFSLPKYRIICFGRKTFGFIHRYFKNSNTEILSPNILKICVTYQDLILDFYGIWHYSNRGYNTKNVIELSNQLKYLDDQFSQNRI